MVILPIIALHHLQTWFCHPLHFFPILLRGEKVPHHGLICPCGIWFAPIPHLTKRYCHPRTPSCQNLGVPPNSSPLLPPYQQVLFVPLPNASFSLHLHSHLPDPNHYPSQSFQTSPTSPVKSHPHSHPHGDTMAFLKYQSDSGIPPFTQPSLLTRLQRYGPGLIVDHGKPFSQAYGLVSSEWLSHPHTSDLSSKVLSWRSLIHVKTPHLINPINPRQFLSHITVIFSFLASRWDRDRGSGIYILFLPSTEI